MMDKVGSQRAIIERRDIPGYPGYRAGSDGKIYSYWLKGAARRFDYDRIPLCFKSSLDGLGHYLNVTLRGPDGVYICTGVHRMVCLAFHGPCPEHMTCSHLNGNRIDNRPENLCWEPHSENVKRKLEHGTDDAGVKNSRAWFDALEIRAVRCLLDSGQFTRAELGKLFETRPHLIGKIARGERYAEYGANANS